MNVESPELLKNISLSEEEMQEIEGLREKVGLLGIVAPRFQRAVESLIPEFYNQPDNDSLGHWWRRIGEYLGEIEGINSETFFAELEKGKTTLDHEVAVKIATATKNYLLRILEDSKKGKEPPSWGSQLQAIYDPPLDEISQIVIWSKD